MNLWIEDPDPKILTNMHFYSWKAGLKTGIYYLRRKPKHNAQQFTIDPTLIQENMRENMRENNESKIEIDNLNLSNSEQGCDMCSG